ncbi:MAG: cation diffusion facilitator family transporter [Anaerolineae bacterium]|nr:cation diffusion facilitator family transporter [Anaerolineae bacterium]
MHQKRAVALGSVLTSAALTALKLAIGLVTGSLAVLAQAADNALDLVTTLMTYFAIRVADHPPDVDHPYGHGKVESLSALGETVLLGITCLVVAYQALRRLLFATGAIQYTGLAVMIMGFSIIVDLVRTTVLRRVAKRHHSQALAADALNFTGDILSSFVVIAGLFFVQVGIPWADPLAALVVAGVVLAGAWRLARQSVDVLLDRAPQELARRVRAVVQGVDGVVTCRGLRVRRVGATTFVEVAIGVDRTTGLESAHQIASAVEAALQSSVAPVDVFVHMEPAARPDETPDERIVLLAQRHGLPVHHVFVQQGPDGLAVDMHCEVNGGLSLHDAHGIVMALEEEIRRALPDVERVVTHIEPLQAGSLSSRQATQLRQRVDLAVQKAVQQIGADSLVGCHQIQVNRVKQHLVLSFHCQIESSVSVETAHHIAGELEARIREQLPELERVVVHTEPVPS